MKIKQELRINDDKLLCLCRKLQWYTKGDIAEYANMFTLAQKCKNIDDLFLIALDIYNHSEHDKDGMSDEYSLSDNVANLMTYIADYCACHTYKIKGGCL